MKPKHFLAVGITVAGVVALCKPDHAPSVLVMMLLGLLYMFERSKADEIQQSELVKLMDRVYDLEKSSVSKEQIKDISQWVAGQKLSRK